MNFALDLLNTVRGNSALGLTQLSLSDFTVYEFDLMNYLQSQLALTRPKPAMKG